MHPTSEEEDTSLVRSKVLIYSSYATGVKEHETRWIHFEPTGSWGESNIPVFEVPRDEATGNAMYLKIGQLERRVDSNEDRVSMLEAEMSDIRSEMASLRGEREVRDISIVEIKKIITDYVEKHGDFWPDELALKHNLSVWHVLDAVEEMAEEGYLEAKDKDAAPRKQ